MQYRLWGGRRLSSWLNLPLPGQGPIGEAWLLSDREEYPSKVASGPFKGRTIAQLMADWPELLLGRFASRFKRFPLLLKFLDMRGMLSVQVHPSDGMSSLIPLGETGKTEAWVILEAGPHSRVYAGLLPNTTAEHLRELSERTVNDHLASFTPVAGQGILIEAGTVHAAGDGTVLFEVQENSDVTFRLYDWNHIDPKTRHPRALQVESALACIDLDQDAVRPVNPVVESLHPVARERLFDCRHFVLWRVQGTAAFTVGAADEPRVLVCVDGAGHVEYHGADFLLPRGAVMLLPAALGACRFRPEGSATLLEIALPGQP